MKSRILLSIEDVIADGILADAFCGYGQRLKNVKKGRFLPESGFLGRGVRPHGNKDIVKIFPKQARM